MNVKFLSIWLLITNLALGLLLYRSFFKSTHFDEISAERLNIVGNDGLHRIVISNESKQHSGRIEGKDIPHRDRPAGIIFFNNEGIC